MDDLISRQAAIDLLKKWSDGYTYIDTETELAIKDFQHLPSIQLQQKVGKWIKMSDADGVYWACSECGENIPRVSHFDPQFDLFPQLESIEKTNFCPNCGAKMKNEGRDDG